MILHTFSRIIRGQVVYFGTSILLQSSPASAIACRVKAKLCASSPGWPIRRGHTPKSFLSFDSGPAGLLESYQRTKGLPSTVAESHFSPVEGLPPCCGPESTVINQLTMWGEDSAGRQSTDRHLRRSQVLPSSLEEADGVSWALYDPTFVIA